MKLRFLPFALALLAIPAHAQDQPRTVTQSVLPVNCGRASTPLYCYGMPLANGGTAWIDIYANNIGFIAFNMPGFASAANITGATRTFNNLGQVTTIIVAFAGADPDGDGDQYVGSMTLNFSYYYSSGGGGRGGAGAGWRFSVTSGSVTIASN
jgi:hypothetical protein